MIKDRSKKNWRKAEDLVNMPRVLCCCCSPLSFPLLFHSPCGLSTCCSQDTAQITMGINTEILKTKSQPAKPIQHNRNKSCYPCNNPGKAQGARSGSHDRP